MSVGAALMDARLEIGLARPVADDVRVTLVLDTRMIHATMSREAAARFVASIAQALAAPAPPRIGDTAASV